MVYLLREKGDTLKATETLQPHRGSFGVKHICTVNGTEFTLSNFRSLMAKNKIKQEISALIRPTRIGQLK